MEEKNIMPSDLELPADDSGNDVESEHSCSVPPLVFDSACLFQGRNEVMIRHHGDIYRLRITRNGKLILNK